MLFTTLVALSPIVAALGAGQVVDLGYAKYEGTLNATTGNTRFFGIRYAAPPTGYGRWQLPKRPDAVGGIIQANVQPPACPSAGLGTSPTTPFHLAAVSADAFSEDCLFLNVFTPQMPAVGVKAKPVVVWIHGGGYQLGSALGFNGEDTIREAHGGVVAVMIQYRLGVYGFLPGNEVKSGGVLNAGLLDQEFALKWVQKHVSKFGGDPSQVTIWGESAGAGSVLQQVIAHDGNTSPPLFRAAISSSSFLPSQYIYNDTVPQKLYNAVVTQANCVSSADTLACLRAVDTVALQVINNNISDSAFFGTAVFVPVVDGTFITQSPTKALKERKVNGEALLAVTNTLEGFIFVDPKLAVSTSEYVRQLFPKFGAREVAKTASQYANIGNTPVDRAISIMGEAILICPTYSLLRAFKGNSYKGVFGIPPAHHGDDLPYYFPFMNPSGATVYNNTAFINAFSESFLNFAVSLNPNVKSDPSNITPLWNVWADNSVEMLFNRTENGDPAIGAITTSRSLLQRCSFWESVGPLAGQ